MCFINEFMSFCKIIGFTKQIYENKSLSPKQVLEKNATLKKLPQQQTLIAKETKPDGESMKDTRQGVHIQIDVAAKALFGVLL